MLPDQEGERESNLDPREAEKHAKQLFQIEEELLRRVANWPTEGKIDLGVTLWKGSSRSEGYVSETEDGCPLQIHLEPQALPSFGARSITLMRVSEKSAVIDRTEGGPLLISTVARLWPFIQTTRVVTLNCLVIGVIGSSIDRVTHQEQDEQLQVPQMQSGWVDVAYFFDQNGNFAKVVDVPLGKPDHRKLIYRDTLQEWSRFLLDEMQAWDFEAAGAALTTIKQSLDQAQQSAQ